MAESYVFVKKARFYAVFRRNRRAGSAQFTNRLAKLQPFLA